MTRIALSREALAEAISIAGPHLQRLHDELLAAHHPDVADQLNVAMLALALRQIGVEAGYSPVIADIINTLWAEDPRWPWKLRADN